MTRVFAVALALATTACFHVRYETGAASAASPRYERRQHAVVLGIAEVSDPVDLAAICPVEVSHIESKASFADFAADFFSFGAYTPQTVVVTCSDRDPAASSGPARPWP